MFLGCGYMDKKNENIFLVLEYCDAGDYSTYLHSKENRPWSERLSLLQDVSEGIEYLHLVLHSIHRDLKSDNILLSHEKSTNMLRAKIADFGLSKLRKNLYDEDDQVSEKEKHKSTSSTSTSSTSTSSTSTSSTSSQKYSSTNLTMTSGVGTPIYMVGLFHSVYLHTKE